MLAVAPRWRPWAALVGAGFTLAVIYSLLTLGWHYVSDVVGGLLMAATWTFFGVFVRSALQARRERGERVEQREVTVPRADLARELVPIAGGTLAAVAIAVAVVLARPASVHSFVRGHEHLIGAIVLIASVALMLVGSLLVMLRRAPRP